LFNDVIIAKNQLNEQEIKNLNNLVNLFLDIAENVVNIHKKLKIQL